MLYANLVSTKLSRNQFCFHNCNMQVGSFLTKLCYRKIAANLLGARITNSRAHTQITTYTHVHMCVYVYSYYHTHLYSTGYLGFYFACLTRSKRQPLYEKSKH